MDAIPAKAPRPAPHQAEVYGERAQALMRTLSVPPTPRNYSIFYACAAGQPTELVREIENAVSKNAAVSEQFLETIYLTYIAEEQARAVQDSASNAKKILSDMMTSVNAFAVDTSAVGKHVAKKLQQLDAKPGEGQVRELAATIVEGAQTIETSSKNISVNLAGAQQEIMQLRETLARVEVEAERDFLTGCFNRRAFDKHLREAILQAGQTKTELTLFMLDIDHFKQFNDKHGHLIGDEVLKIVSKALMDTLKGSDTVARYGGEEFAVLLPRTPIAGGMTVAEVIRNSIANKELKRKSTGEIFGVITVSIGVAVFHPGEEPTTFIERADKALYNAKRTGRNRVLSS